MTTGISISSRQPEFRQLWEEKFPYELTWQDIPPLNEAGFSTYTWNRPEEDTLGFRFVDMAGDHHSTRFGISRTPLIKETREDYDEFEKPGVYFNLLTNIEGQTVEQWQEEIAAVSGLLAVLRSRREQNTPPTE